MKPRGRWPHSDVLEQDLAEAWEIARETDRLALGDDENEATVSAYG